MLPRCTRALIGGAAALALSVLGVLPQVVPAAAATSPIPTFKPGHVLFDTGIDHDVTQAQAQAAATAATTFSQYKATVKVATHSYTYVMAGKNPAIKTARPSSAITTALVPLIMKFSNGDTWNPAKADSCDAGASALTRTQNSPIVKSQAWRWGGTAVGTGQVTDAFQRAEFWKYAKPAGINPKFGITLSVKTLEPVTIQVPNTDAAHHTIGCGSGLAGAAEIHWFDAYIQSHVIPSLASQGVGPSTLPIFLLHNFVEYDYDPALCCVLGYHSAYPTSHGIQTYGVSIYDNTGLFTGSSDITALSHEVAEWQNDPYTNNPTPAWGHTGQVGGCQTNLEVGDPLTGTTFADTVGGFTYHPQELAFFSWFYHQKPSLGVNSWYSDQGTFKTFAAPCA